MRKLAKDDKKYSTELGIVSYQTSLVTSVEGAMCSLFKTQDLGDLDVFKFGFRFFVANALSSLFSIGRMEGIGGD